MSTISESGRVERVCKSAPARSSVRVKCAHCFGCDRCGSTNILRSRRHGVVQWVMKRLAILPWRCMDCKHRFFRFSPAMRPVKFRASQHVRLYTPPTVETTHLAPEKAAEAPQRALG